LFRAEVTVGLVRAVDSDAWITTVMVLCDFASPVRLSITLLAANLLRNRVKPDPGSWADGGWIIP